MLKVLLRRLPGVAAVNARVRARAQAAAYSRLAAHYRNLHARPTPHFRPLPLLSRPRVLFVGTDEQQDRSGFVQALERCCDLVLFTGEDGGYGHNDSRAPAIRREANSRRLDAILDALASEGRLPALVLAQTWSTLMDPAAFDRARARGCRVANIGMDDRHQFRGIREAFGWGGTLGLVGHIDLALTTAPECVRWYEAEGCPALFFPLASDPDIFRPMPDLPRIHDLCFVGARYGIRERLVRALRRAGVRVSAFGGGWEGGRIDVAGMARLFAQSKIVLGVGTIGHTTDLYSLKLRDFDAPMSGSCYLTHDNPDLHPLFVRGEEFVAYRSIDECVDRARALLADEATRERIAAAGRARALRDHTWTRRLRDLFTTLAAGHPAEDMNRC
jgi:spore maturation protein CgeB